MASRIQLGVYMTHLQQKLTTRREAKLCLCKHMSAPRCWTSEWAASTQECASEYLRGAAVPAMVPVITSDVKYCKRIALHRKPSSTTATAGGKSYLVKTVEDEI